MSTASHGPVDQSLDLRVRRARELAARAACVAYIETLHREFSRSGVTPETQIDGMHQHLAVLAGGPRSYLLRSTWTFSSNEAQVAEALAAHAEGTG